MNGVTRGRFRKTDAIRSATDYAREDTRGGGQFIPANAVPVVRCDDLPRLSRLPDKPSLKKKNAHTRTSTLSPKYIQNVLLDKFHKERTRVRFDIPTTQARSLTTVVVSALCFRRRSNAARKTVFRTFSDRPVRQSHCCRSTATSGRPPAGRSKLPNESTDVVNDAINYGDRANKTAKYMCI